MSALGKPTFPSMEVDNSDVEEEQKLTFPSSDVHDDDNDDDYNDDDDDVDDVDVDFNSDNTDVEEEKETSLSTKIDDDDSNVEEKSDLESVTSDFQSNDETSLLDSDDDDEDDGYLQKFEKDIQNNTIEQFHPETNIHNYEEVKKLSKVTRNENGIVVDPLHKTIPYLTKYEKTRILGQRAAQINSGAKPLISLKADVIDGYLIAQEELKSKKIPFIIRRPIPGGGFEYWRVTDLEII
jgi:DNA-directed RNA polymerase subunit K/omega